MPQCCSAGSREAAVHTGLTPGASNPGGCAVSSWPGAGKLHPADACCCFFPSPWLYPSGGGRGTRLGCGSWKKRLSLPFTPAWAWQGEREAQEESWLWMATGGKPFAGPLQKRGQGLCWAFSGLSGTENKAGLPITGFTYSTPQTLSQLTCKGKQLRVVGSQEACHLPPCATNLHMHRPPCSRSSLSQQREGMSPETRSA